MKNMTISLDDEVVQWVCAQAAKNDISISRVLNRLLKVQMYEDGYNTAMQQFLSSPVTALKVKDEFYPDRGSLYE